MLDQNIIESSDINDLEEIYASQQQQQKKKEVSQTGQNLGDVAEVIERKPKKPQPQVSVTPQLTPTPVIASPVIPETVVATAVPVEQTQPIVSPSIVAAPTPEPIIIQKESSVQENSRPSLDGIINKVLERKKKIIDDEAEAKKQSMENMLYENLFTLIESASKTQVQSSPVVVANPPTPIPVVAAPQPTVVPQPIPQIPEPIHETKPRYYEDIPKSPVSPKQSNPKKSYSWKTTVSAIVLTVISGISLVFIIQHFIH